jgi:hypothetical protein
MMFYKLLFLCYIFHIPRSQPRFSGSFVTQRLGGKPWRIRRQRAADFLREALHQGLREIIDVHWLWLKRSFVGERAQGAGDRVRIPSRFVFDTLALDRALA